MTQPKVLSPQQQQEQQALQEISQYVGAKWGGRPVVMAFFGGPGLATFQAMLVGNPSEGQFLIAGEEFQAMGNRIRGARMDAQMKVTINQP